MATCDNRTMFNEPNWVKGTAGSRFPKYESEFYMPDKHKGEHFEFWLYNQKSSMKVGFRSFSGGILVIERIPDMGENLQDSFFAFELISGCFEVASLIDLRNFLMKEGLIPSYSSEVNSIVFKYSTTAVIATPLLNNAQILYYLWSKQEEIELSSIMSDHFSDIIIDELSESKALVHTAS